MATPYAPSQLSIQNFDATQSATATWIFSSPDLMVTQYAFDIQIYNNDTNALVLDTGWVTSGLAQYTIPANTLVNRTTYKWRIQYKDTAGNVSPWSQYQIFICSSTPITNITFPTPNQTILGNTITITCSYSQAQNVQQQSYRIIVYALDQTTVIADSGVQNGTSNQFTFSQLTNGTYCVQATVTSVDGLSASTGKVFFTLNYASALQSSNITLTPLPNSASIRLDWMNLQQILGNYQGSGATYQTGKFNQAIQVSAFGEKVWWQFAQLTQFTYTSWFIPLSNSSEMNKNQVFVQLQADNNNYIQMRYDPVISSFLLDKTVNGVTMTTKSNNGLTFSANSQIFIAIQQTSNSVTGYVGLNGVLYTLQFQPYQPGTSQYGVSTYGSGIYAMNDIGIVPNIQYAYIGCTPVNGNEANALFDQTHLTTNLLSQSQINSIYVNSTLQTFVPQQTVFLANFDGNLIGGTTSALNISSWNIYRTSNGVQKLVGTIPYNANNPTVSFTDSTPLSNTQYIYTIYMGDTSGNLVLPQVVTGSITFDGWWLTDPVTGAQFQFLYNIEDTSIKTNYMRTEYQTFGVYPIVVYSPMKYRTGKLTGLISDLTNTQTPYQLYQSLQSMIDNHRPLVLRGSDGTGLVVDCYDQTRTISDPTNQYFNKVEVSWTEVASL